MNRVYHSNRNIVYSCKYHIVFCPKYRRKVLVNGVDVRLKELIQSIYEHFSTILRTEYNVIFTGIYDVTI